MKSKYSWYTFPKDKNPTVFIEGGTAQIGSNTAFNKLSMLVGKDRADAMYKNHTKSLWRWGELK